MTNPFDEISSEEMEDIKENSSLPSIYTPDEEMLKANWEYDSSGLYIPYTFKYERNPDPRDIYLKIERIPDIKKNFLKYSWTVKKDGEFKTLNFFRRDFLPVEEDIDSGGKASINKKLSHTGRLARLNSETGSYKGFMEEVIMTIINSDCLEVFKEIEFDFPILNDEEESEEDEISEVDEEYLSRLNPELSEDDIADAMEVKEWIDDYGLIKYWDSIVNKFHKGNHKAIYRKHL